MARTDSARRGTAMVATGIVAVVAGGLVSAVTGPLDLERGSWAAAYLVLVVGVAQTAMGLARGHHDARPDTGWAQWGCWNGGSAAVIGGTVVAEPWIVDIGSGALFVALALAFDAARTRDGSRSTPPSWLPAYRVLLLILAISIPVGIVLSHLRHS